MAFNTLFLANYNPHYLQAYQTEISHFAVDATIMPAWTTGLELLGRPLSARLTSFAKKHYLDIYYQ